MRRLPIFETFQYIVRTAFLNLDTAFRLAWPWMLILGPIYVALQVITWAEPDVLDGKHLLILVIPALSLLSAYAFATFAVNWHRFAVLGETARGRDVLRAHGRSWSYLGNFILIGLIGVLILLCLGGVMLFLPKEMFLAAQTSFAVWSILSIVSFLIFLFITAYMSRLLVKLVAVALGEKITLGKVLEATHENTLRIAGVTFLLWLIFVPVDWGLPYLMGWGAMNSALPTAILVGVELFSDVIKTFIGIVTLTALYKFFIEQREIGG